MGRAGERADHHTRGVRSVKATPHSPPSRQTTRQSRRRAPPSPEMASTKLSGSAVSQKSRAPLSEMSVTMQLRGKAPSLT